MDKALQIINAIHKAGGTAYLVGGIVRDKLLGLPTETKDIDIEVFYLAPDKLEELLKSFGEVKLVGKSFGCYKIDNCDISIARVERKVTDGHKGFEIIVNPELSIEEACIRRDLTMNAILYSPIEKRLYDPYDGYKDLLNRSIRHVNATSFIEDPLRILRIAQFMSRFEMIVHNDTTELCKKYVHSLKELPKERVFEEIKKLLMKGVNPSVGFYWLLDIGALDIILPGLSNLLKVEDDKKHHPEPNVFIHTMMALDVLNKEDRSIDIMLAILFHDYGKYGTYTSYDSAHGHAELGLKEVEVLLRSLTEENDIIDDTLKLIKFHMVPYDILSHMDKKDTLHRMIKKLALKVNIIDLLKVHKADVVGRMKTVTKEDLLYIEVILYEYNRLKETMTPLLHGRDLIAAGFTPSPAFGEILKKVYANQIEGIVKTKEEALALAKVGFIFEDGRK
jgi:tRNA nucleotidyltransferase (CCA-adding enzyme)